LALTIFEETVKICYKCKIEKDPHQFNKDKSTKDGLQAKCQQCQKQYSLNNKEVKKIRQHQYYLDNKKEINHRNKRWKLNNKEMNRQTQTEYNRTHKKEAKKWRLDNKEHTREFLRNWRRNKRKANLGFKLAELVSRAINKYLNSFGAKKNASRTKYLSYTDKQLKEHIEKLFSHPNNLTPDGKIWMNQINHGTYDPNTWDDNNPLTWKWQLDHIVPHSTFEYKSVEDEAFKKCWALENLRPYSAKQNILDGSGRSRH